ncbi:MAG: hypothetical protein M3P85_03285 [Actinomycetota bacterium]|jgi:hypothetical protein|nr:hypothetical protein [Actinomycetota bacterium]
MGTEIESDPGSSVETVPSEDREQAEGGREAVEAEIEDAEEGGGGSSPA